MRVFLSLYWEKCEKSMKIANTSDNPAFTIPVSPEIHRDAHLRREREKRREERKKGRRVPGELLRAREGIGSRTSLIDRCARIIYAYYEGWAKFTPASVKSQIPRFLQGRRKIANDMPETAPVESAKVSSPLGLLFF